MVLENKQHEKQQDSRIKKTREWS